MNNRWTFGIVLLLILVALYLVYQQFQGLQLQVADRPLRSEDITDAADCRKLAEADANTCLLRLAIENTDASICEAITKTSLVEQCQREVELSQ